MLEIRDRRNPEVVISRETLTRGIDYNLDPVTGQIFFLRYISTFDHSAEPDANRRHLRTSR